MRTFLLVAVAGVLSRSLFAAPVTGTFTMSGLFTLTNSTMSWNSNQPPNLPNLFTATVGTGGFSTENGQNSIANLSFSTDPVGQFAAQSFIDFNQDPSVPGLEITNIVPGIYTNAGCLSLPAPGETCTPNVNGGAGFLNFTDDPSSQSTATWAFEGTEAGSPGTVWTATFTAQFNVPYQTVLVGTVSDSYTANVTVSAAPEPSPQIMVCIGLALATLWRAASKTNRTILPPPPSCDRRKR
jgi:hypothetical protein